MFGSLETIEILLRQDNLELVLEPGAAHPKLDRLLAQNNATSFVFLTLAEPGKAAEWSEQQLQKRRDRFSGMRWINGELRRTRSSKRGKQRTSLTPGAMAFDLRRHEAREIARELSVKQFYWGARGTALEIHPVAIFDPDEASDWSVVKDRARQGRNDLARAARRLDHLDEALLAAGSSITRLATATAALLVVAVMAFALQAFADRPGDQTSLLRGLLTNPVLLPALVGGVYLRSFLLPSDNASRRDLNEHEARRVWQVTSPHVLVLWAVAAVAVALLTAGRLLTGDGFSITAFVDQFSVRLLLTLWIALPIATARSIEGAVRASFEAAVTAVVFIVVLKLTLFLTHWLSDLVLGLVSELLPWAIPEALKAWIASFAGVGSELFFLVIMVGYSWTRCRQYFERLATAPA